MKEVKIIDNSDPLFDDEPYECEDDGSDDDGINYATPESMAAAWEDMKFLVIEDDEEKQKRT